jgi:hypothetical protein
MPKPIKIVYNLIMRKNELNSFIFILKKLLIWNNYIGIGIKDEKDKRVKKAVVYTVVGIDTNANKSFWILFIFRT